MTNIPTSRKSSNKKKTLSKSHWRIMLEVVKYFIYFVSVVCKPKTVQSIDQDNNYFMGSSFKSVNFGKAIQNAALQASVLKTVLVETEFQCMMECVLHKPCLSYNFDTTSRESGYLCQLSGKDRFLGMLAFNTTMKGYLYRGIKVRQYLKTCIGIVKEKSKLYKMKILRTFNCIRWEFSLFGLET